MKRAQIFEATDGRTFATEAECKEHEKQSIIAYLAGRSSDDIQNAIDRKDIKLADAIERVGSIISAKRRESGEFRSAKGGLKNIPGKTDGPTSPEIFQAQGNANLVDEALK